MSIVYISFVKTVLVYYLKCINTEMKEFNKLLLEILKHRKLNNVERWNIKKCLIVCSKKYRATVKLKKVPVWTVGDTGFESLSEKPFLSISVYFHKKILVLCNKMYYLLLRQSPCVGLILPCNINGNKDFSCELLKSPQNITDKSTFG